MWIASFRRRGRGRRRRSSQRLVGEQLEARELLAAISEWQPVGPGGGGALFSPAINPHDHAEMFIPSDMSQLFHTSDAGQSWETLDFREIQGNWATNVQFTTDPDILYAIDYSLVDLDDAARPSKSIDGGETWTPLAADPTGGEAFTLWADFDDPARLIVSTWTELYLSADGGQSFDLRFATSDSSAGLHIGGALFDGAHVYLGTNQGLLVSSNGGRTFDVESYGGIPADERVVSFAGAVDGTATRFYAVTMFAGDVFAGVRGFDHEGYRGVYTRDLGQTSWSRSTAGIAADADPFFVAAAANDVNVVYVGGGSDQESPIVYKSIDGGTSWSSILLTNANQNVATGWSGQGGARGWSYGEAALGFAVARNDPNHVLITDFGFAHHTADGGTSWQVLNVVPEDRNAPGQVSAISRSYRSSGLDNTSIWGVAWADETHLVGLYSDIRGAISDDGGASWTFDYTGHNQNSIYRAVRADSGTVYAATSTVHDLYQSTHLTDARIDGGGGKVIYSNDLGASWQTLHDFGNVVAWVELDPAVPNRLYASVAHSSEGGIYVSDNIQLGAASTWRKLTDPPRTQGHAHNVHVLEDGTLLATFSGRRGGSPTAFTPSSGVFVSSDGGQSWQDRSDDGMLYWTRDIVVDPHDAHQDTWYAGVFSGWGGPPNGLGGLYKTTDRGQTWDRILALDRVAGATISPLDPDEMYLTTEGEGLWHTENLSGGVTFAAVASYPFRSPVRVVYNPFDPAEVWVTSFGNGLRVGRAAAAHGFSLASFEPTASGFVAEFNGALDPRGLNLFDQQTLGLGPSDVAFEGASLGAIAGSLVVDSSNRRVTYVKSGGLLEPDTYTVTLRGSSGGFQDAAGRLLDGNGDGTPGGDAIRTFTVASLPDVTIGLPDFVRGPGQLAELPADTGLGIPLTISSGENVQTIDLQINYDPVLLTVTGVSVGESMPPEATVSMDASTAGLLRVSLSSPQLPTGEVVFAHLLAEVSSGAAYGKLQVLDLHAASARGSDGNELSVVADDAIHLASFWGDVTGNGRINAGDAAAVARYAAQLDTGFASSLLADPIVLADISGNRRVNASDASLVARFAALIAVPQIPPLPGGLLSPRSTSAALDASHPLGPRNLPPLIRRIE